jgi:glutamate--cysteine ligase
MGTERALHFFKELNQKQADVLALLREQTSTCGYPVYSSMDIRDAGWKVCAVDVNLFPAGFNLLDPRDHERGSQFMAQFLSAKLFRSPPWKITVIPEAHTNNTGYLENLSGIIRLLEKAGAEVRLAWSGPPIPQAWKLKTPQGYELNYLPAEEALDGAHAIILNHDLSGGLPKFLEGISLPTFPSPALGWYRRRKSKHFEIVSGLLKIIQKNFSFFDPWFFEALSSTLTQMDIEKSEDRQRLADEADKMLSELSKQYKERNIPEEPALFLKNNAGTYGMGVIQIRKASEIMQLDRSSKNKMRKGKEAVPISDIILQEAIPTSFHYLKDPSGPNSRVAGEPTLYMIDSIPIGGFMRIHENLGPEAQWKNLNQPHGILEPLGLLSDPCSGRPFPKARDRCPREEIEGKYLYHFLAKLHATAAGLEECPPE